jgi:hypothetical protein
MQTITSVAGLKNAIQLLEADQDAKGQHLKEQFSLACDSLKPANLLKSALNKIFSISNLTENITDTSLGVAGGLLLRRLFVGSSGNVFRKLIGSFLQFGVSNFIAQNADMIKTVAHSTLQHFFGNREVRAKKHYGARKE